VGLFFIFDNRFKKNIHKYDRESYVKDLNSKARDKKIRAIWGIEGKRDYKSIDKLQRIINDASEDKQVRKEAEIAVKNLRNRKNK
jgi:hypothetical protein